MSAEQSTQKVNEIKQMIDKYNMLVRGIVKYQKRVQTAVSETEQQDGTEKLQYVRREIIKLGKIIRQELTLMKQQSAANGVYQQHYQNLARKFMDCVAAYQSVEVDFQNQTREKTRRQYKMVKPNATGAEVEAAIDEAEQGGDGVGNVFSQSLMQSSRRGEAQALRSELESRNTALTNIARQVEELHALFQDMATLVQEQDEQIQIIVNHAEDTATNTNNAANEMRQAVVTKKKNIRRKRMLICCCLVLLLVIGIVLFIYFGLPLIQKAPSSSNSNGGDSNSQPATRRNN
ncbi:hypothetical protein MIR68_005922 [Amoeboaphelidium protococcarum]|nr:hypothetical protein MIR68_005922 [Amoeboaphelidium protococcarum]